ncbi:MAG TPA: glutamate formimidoyltransferase, partial [Miltoncostaeales bacterium]|nr:glutamate formimidoyltransferase [Miltoncostaeales bacterium]
MNDSDTGQTRPDRGVVTTLVEPRMPTVVAVPNVSEGADRDVIAALRAAIVRPGVKVVNTHSDPDHNRTVFTAIGNPLAMQDAMVDLAGAAMDMIDIRRVQGVHPRIGALDIVPIVALQPQDMAVACELASGIAQRIGDELQIPVFRYGEIASNPARTRPHDFRVGGVDRLAERIGDDLEPDDGPFRVHATAGAVLVGARDPLIALNVWLPDGELDQARAIAARVRESGGGPPGLRALGLYLPHAGAAQVSMNLEDFRRTPPAVAVRAVHREAERLGIVPGATELVGLIPRAALVGTTPTELQLAGFRPGMVLDTYLS